MFESRAVPTVKYTEVSSRFSIFKGFDTSQLCCGVVHYVYIRSFLASPRNPHPPMEGHTLDL
jgi:hypothetical protein